MSPLARLAAAALLIVAPGCHSKTAEDVKPCVDSTGRTVSSAAKTGATTAAEGAKTLGTSIGGFFQGGSDEAKRRWQEGSQKTKESAEHGGSDTRATAKQEDCR